MKKNKDKEAIQNKNVIAEVKTNQLDIKDSHIIILFGVITFLFFREILLQQKFLWEDFIFYYYPVRNFAAVTLSQGILPHWNPYTFGGMPFLADIQTSIFYPFHLLLTVFVIEDKLPFVILEYLLIFHYFMAGVFSYYLARSLDLNRWASVLSGITFMFCGFMVTHAMHETMIIQFAYMPLIFMFYNKGLNAGKLKYILLTGLFVGVTILCGHPQITLYMFFIFLLFGLYQIFFKFKENDYKINASLFKFIAIVAAPFVIGIMVGTIQLLPTMTLAGLSERAAMSYEQSLESSLNYHNLFTLFSPHFFGQSNATQTGAMYWGHKGGAPHHYWESCIYIGLSALTFGVLGIIALWKERIIKFLAIISLLSIFFILGDNFILYKLFYNFVPGFNIFRCIGRFGLVLAFSFSLLGAYGFDYFIKNVESEKVKQFIKYFIVLISGFIVLWLLYQLGVFKGIANVYKNEKLYDNSTFQLLKTVLILLTLLGLMILFKKKFVSQYITLLFVILLSFADLYVFGSNENNGNLSSITTGMVPQTIIQSNENNGNLSPEEYYVKQELVNRIKQNYNINNLYRIKTRVTENQSILADNQGNIDFIFLLDGYTPLNLKDRFPPFKTNELMNVKYTATLDTVTKEIYSEYNENYMPRAWVSYYPIVESSLEKVAEILEDLTFEIEKKVIIDQELEIFIDTNSVNNPNKQITFKSYNINEIILSVETNENGILVLSEVYYPNWKVFVDGVEKPMLRCDYSLRGVAIEKGNHTVTFKYVDKDFQLGAIITLFTLAIVVGGFIKSRK